MNNFIDHFHSLSHLLAYIIMLTFIGYYWKNQIWKSIKGFNGKLQLIELLKFGAIIAFFAYSIEVVFGEKEFDVYFGGLLLCIVIASNNSKIDLGGILSKVVGTNKKEEKKENKEESY